MNYWIIKANPAYEGNYDFTEMFEKGHIEEWGAKRILKGFSKGDKVVFWQSGSGFKVIALGEVIEPFIGIEDGRTIFSLKCTSGLLENQPTIVELRELSLFENAGFLKSGPADTIHKLTPEQGKYLFERAKNLHQSKRVFDDIEEESLEGSKKFLTHLRIERDSGLRARKLKEFENQNGSLFCEACGDDMEITSEILKGHVFEIHHRIPLKSLKETKTKLADLAVICPSCHRLIHKLKPIPSVEKLASKIRAARKRRKES